MLITACPTKHKGQIQERRITTHHPIHNLFIDVHQHKCAM
jgi:hypothetical protein